MSCEHVALDALSGYADGELPAGQREWWDDHLPRCRDCRERLARIQGLRATVRSRVPPLEPSAAFRDDLRRLLREAPSGRPPAAASWRRWGMGIAAALLFSLGLGLGYVGRGTYRTNPIIGQVVAGHVRSLAVDHLVDIASSEHHVVRPWFTGKLDFAPPVPELAPDGFPLVGGRIDYLADRTVAALVYHHGPHTINLLVWPAPGLRGCGHETPIVRQGFNLSHGHAGGMEFWAISDLNRAELEEFVIRWHNAAAPDESGCAPATGP